MWYEVENGNRAMPSEVDTTSSRAYVYVRKDITLVDDMSEDPEHPAHYRWMEMKIPREMWEVTQKALSHESALDDVYAALTELAEMILDAG